MSYLVINSGSSTIKLAIFSVDDQGMLRRQLHGVVDRHNVRPTLHLANAAGQTLVNMALSIESGNPQDTLAALLAHGQRFFDHDRLIAAGHRIVHGGTQFSTPVPVDDTTLAALDALTPLAPQHQPYNLAGIRALAALKPDLPQVACFDTAFHRTKPLVAQRFALPKEWFEHGVLRYGFHGLSYEFIARRLADLDPTAAARRTVVAHLGHGASVCALEAGVSVATSMGFSTLDGIPMGTRCGRLDPGVLLYMAQQKSMSADQIGTLLYEHSGLLGLSGISDDMRELLASEAPAAAEAIDVFVYRTVREIGGMIAALGGIDALVFTGGIGEHAAPIRERISSAFAWLGLQLDVRANAAASAAARISTADSRVRAWVIPTDEEYVIADYCQKLVISKAEGAVQRNENAL